MLLQLNHSASTLFKSDYHPVINRKPDPDEPEPDENGGTGGSGSGGSGGSGDPGGTGGGTKG